MGDLYGFRTGRPTCPIFSPIGPLLICQCTYFLFSSKLFLSPNKYIIYRKNRQLLVNYSSAVTRYRLLITIDTQSLTLTVGNFISSNMKLQHFDLLAGSETGLHACLGCKLLEWWIYKPNAFASSFWYYSEGTVKFYYYSRRKSPTVYQLNGMSDSISDCNLTLQSLYMISAPCDFDCALSLSAFKRWHITTIMTANIINNTATTTKISG